MNILVLLCAFSLYGSVKSASLRKRDTTVVKTEGANQEESYGIRLNGNTQNGAPPWPKPELENAKMFLLPKKLQNDDLIRVTGQLNQDQKRLTLRLLSASSDSIDYNNIACQVDVHFDENVTYLQTVTDGNPHHTTADDPPSSYFGNSTFDISFTPLQSGGTDTIIEVKLHGTYYSEVKYPTHKIENVRYLSVNGDVQKIDKLEFVFAP